MIINQANLQAAFTGFKVIFQSAFDAAKVSYDRIATTVPSTTKQEVYPWLGKTTRFREWVGSRVVQGLAAHDFTIKNKHYENTVGISKDDFEDDSYGIYTPVIAQMGEDSRVHPDILVYGLLKTGINTKCYDGQYFFDTDHPSFNADGSPTQAANVDSGGTGPYWYLFDTSKVVKPIIFQKRKDYLFVPRTRPDDPHVFDLNEFLYGVDARVNVGFGLWQLAYASNQPLDSTHYGAARAALASLRGENGDALSIMPDLLVVPPALEGAANTIIKAEVINQTSNVWKGTADVLMTARVA
jgi:phage major head subunit gpT-like protein